VTGQQTSLGKGLAVLHVLAESDGEDGMTMADLAATVGLNRTTAYRLCEGLARSGWVQLSASGERGGTRRVDLGPRALGFGILAASKYDPEERLQRVVDELAHEVGETVHAAALDGLDVIHIGWAVPDDGPRMALRLGARELAHVTGLGKAMLATLPRDEVLRRYRQEQLVTRTPNSLSTRTELLAELERVQELGYAVDNQEAQPGVFCVAAPVFARPDATLYSISVTSFPIELEGDRLPEIVHAVKQAAERASHALGGTVPPRWAAADALA
jgi:IclR family acetate operon transcriptional repressor